MEIVLFNTAFAFRSWLKKNHDSSAAVWLRFAKKTSSLKSLTYADALDEALCYGWIDGRKKTFDELSWIQRFSPRQSRSAWSKMNTRHVERLIEAGRMTASGLKAVEAAKADGRWQAAYDSPADAAVPEDFLKELEKNGKAKAFFHTLNRANLYSIVYRLQTARKTETREKRLKAIVEMMDRGIKFHP